MAGRANLQLPKEVKNMTRDRCVQFIAGAAAGLACSAAAAEEAAVAYLAHADGNILLSQDRNIASAAKGAPLYRDVRILVTSNSMAVIQYYNGCRIELRAGDRLDVASGEKCSSPSSDKTEERGK